MSATLEERIEQWQIARGLKKRQAEKLASDIVLKDQAGQKIENVTDEEANTLVFIFDPWSSGVSYSIGDVVRFEKMPYRCVQAHTSQSAWTPPSVPALFTPLRNTVGSNPDSWVQPTGAQDAYNTGDRVTHDNPNDGGNVWIYESLIAANTQEPGRDGTFDRWWSPVEAV